MHTHEMIVVVLASVVMVGVAAADALRSIRSVGQMVSGMRSSLPSAGGERFALQTTF